MSQRTLTLTILSTYRDNTFRTVYIIDLNCTHPNLQVNRRWWIVANDAASHRPGIGVSFKYGGTFYLAFYLLTSLRPSGLVKLNILWLFPFYLLLLLMLPDGELLS